MPFQPEDIAAKQFLVRARGYDRDEVSGFLRAVAADYDEALRALEAALVADAEPAASGDAEPPMSVSERWTAAITERRAVDLLDTASRRLEEVAERERRVAEAELRVAQQLRAVRDALEHARVSVRHAAIVNDAEAVPA